MDKIICVGKNYLKHAKELGDQIPEEPLYFLKPPSTLFHAESMTEKFELPAQGEVHHELELVFRIAETDGRYEFTHYTLGLDLTLRDLQTRLKKAGQPWEKAKVFKNSAVLGQWQMLSSVADVLSTPFELQVNGTVRQKGLGKDMRWSPEELLQDLQRWFPIRNGDILYTGTPEGVGPLKKGDLLRASCGPVQFGLECV